MTPEFSVSRLSTATHHRWPSAHPLTVGYGDRTGGVEKEKKIGGIPATLAAEIPVSES